MNILLHRSHIFTYLVRSLLGVGMLAGLNGLTFRADLTSVDTQWESTGLGKGGYFCAAAYHPTREGVIYPGGNVAGIYKSEDHGRTWRMIHNTPTGTR